MYIDKDAPLQVVKNALTTSLICGFLSGVYGSFKGGEVKPIFLAGSAAFNSAVAGATFFGVREFVVSPALVSTLPWKQYRRRRRHLELSSANGKQAASLAESADEPATLSDLRTHKLLDTGLSGAITGGVLNSLKRGRAGIIPGIATGTLFCAALQFGYNLLSVSRVKFAARRIEGLPIETTSPSLTEEREQPTEPARSATERVLTALGFHISDERYLARLKATRDKYLEQIRLLEKKLEEEQRENAPDQ